MPSVSLAYHYARVSHTLYVGNELRQTASRRLTCNNSSLRIPLGELGSFAAGACRHVKHEQWLGVYYSLTEGNHAFACRSFLNIVPATYMLGATAHSSKVRLPSIAMILRHSKEMRQVSRGYYISSLLRYMRAPLCYIYFSRVEANSLWWRTKKRLHNTLCILQVVCYAALYQIEAQSCVSSRGSYTSGKQRRA
jgi:hypothetical protein